MLDGFSTTINCAVNRGSLTHCFTCLKEIMNHPILQEEEKFLWLWFYANQSTINTPFSCSLSYEQISTAVNKSSQKIHRILTRLRTMGVLIANIPIYYGELTQEMIQKVHNIRLLLPPKGQPDKENDQDTILMYHENRQKITLNLLNKNKTNKQKN